MENKSDEIIKTSLRLPRNLIDAVQRACIDLRITQTQAMTDALKKWLAEKNVSVPMENPGTVTYSIPRQTERWCRKLIGILTSGHRAAIDAITKNLVAFEELSTINITIEARGRDYNAEAAGRSSDEEPPAQSAATSDITEAAGEFHRAQEEFRGHEEKLRESTERLPKRGKKPA